MKAGKTYPDYSNPDNFLSPLRAIRATCLDCVCDNRAEVERCQITGCALWPYRMGHNPKRKGVGRGGFTEKQPETAVESGRQPEKP